MTFSVCLLDPPANNSVPDDGSQESFYQKVKSVMCSNNSEVNITVLDVITALNKQKNVKAAGSDNVPTGDLKYGGLRLCVHLSLIHI